MLRFNCRINKKASGTEIHTQGKPSAGMKLEMWIKPDTVSFYNCEYREGSCSATAGAYWAGLNGLSHPVTQYYAVAQNNKVNKLDTAYHLESRPSPWGDGTFQWIIPCEVKPSGGSVIQAGTVQHDATINTAGTVSVTKGTGSVTKAVNDPSVP